MEVISEYSNDACIYKITCIITGKVYIGKTINLRKRINKHKNCRDKSKTICYFQKAILKYGWDSFGVEILKTVPNFDKLKDNNDLLKLESHYIELFDSTNVDKGYNICKFSNDRTGVKLSEEHKEKIRQSNIGKPKSEETRQKMRKPKSDQGKANMKNCQLGKFVSEETREKIRQSKLGGKHSEETKEKMRQAKLRKLN